ncbi:hypothetical protein SY27_05075, partial [Flavobacterium sp. 316]|uniref:hypothetical protein n=1 Tax=Flavobacterium sp. 316 TaxID=1603293 RepID=UPI0005DBD001
MDKIYVLKNGLAVKLPLSLFEDLIVDIDGFLISFKYKRNDNFVSYHFYYDYEFKNERYQNKSYVPDGYYEEEKALTFFAYKQSTAFNPNSVPTPVEMKQLYCFDTIKFLENYPPKLDDEVTVETINSTLPDFIYEENKAVFKIINNENGELKRYYLKKGEIDFPKEQGANNGYVSYELIQHNFLSSQNPIFVSLGRFYHKNFVERRTAWIINNNETQRFDRITTLIVLRIRKIVEDVFPLFLDSIDWSIVDGVGYDLSVYQQSDLDTDLKKTLYEIKKSWAIYYIPTSTNTNLHVYNAILPSLPDYDTFKKYYQALVNFYTNCYRVKLQFSDKTETEKLELLIKCLPASALNIIPLEQRINLLINLAKGRIFEDKENLVLKIILSIDPSDATTFLYKLEKTIIYEGEDNYTLYEALYNKIDDQIAWFGKDNRKALMLQLFKLWYVSAYNPSMDTGDFADTTVQDLEDIESALIGYEANTVLLNYDAEKFFGFYTDNMDFSFSNKKIAVFEEKQEIIKVAPNYGNDFQTEKVRTISVKIGTYNIFQAISLNDYKENDVAIKIPLVDLEQDGQKVTALLPLFYLKYMDDYGDNEDLWTGIGLTLDVALTFTGVGNINKLRYLRHIGKFGKAYRAWRNGNATAEVLFTVKALWSATQGVAALFEITSSLLSIYLEYYTNSCNNYKTDVTANINNITPNGQLPDDSQQSDEYKRCKLIDRILFAIQIGSLGMDLLASKMIKKHSKELELLGFPPEWDLPQFQTLKTTFQDLNNLDINNYFNFINQIPDTYRATIGNKLLSYGDVTKQNEFLNDFGAVEQTEGFWKMMAKDGAEGVENWKKLLENGIENERRIFTYLEDTSLTNSLVRFYQDSNLKTVLRKLDEAAKQKFLREMGDISPTNFAKFVSDPELVNKWLKYYDDAILRSDFKALG